MLLLSKLQHAIDDSENEAEKRQRQRTGKVDRPAKAPDALRNEDTLIFSAKVDEPELPVVGVEVVSIKGRCAHGAMCGLEFSACREKGDVLVEGTLAASIGDGEREASIQDGCHTSLLPVSVLFQRCICWLVPRSHEPFDFGGVVLFMGSSR